MATNIAAGIDIICGQQASYKNARVALVTNDVATSISGLSSRIALLKAGFTLVKLFSPEHGLSAGGDDGAYQQHHTDALTLLPVISLYGDTLAPTDADLQDIDIVLFDIPDVGCRFYTYLWTMTYTMEACAANQKSLIILDRPNPLGGDLRLAEGPMLDEAHCSSFIGRWSIPVRHSCSFGELASYFAATLLPGLDLKIMKVQYWQRAQNAVQAGWHFAPTSPAITDFVTALLYPGMGLLEGISVNEGRGTGHPFTQLGAPWINGQQLAEAFAALTLPGIEAGEISYTPSWGLYAGEQCHGVQFAISGSTEFRPVATGIALLELLASMYPANCTERKYPTVANPGGGGHLDKLLGVWQSFGQIKKGSLLPLTKVYNQWMKTIAPYLLYG